MSGAKLFLFSKKVNLMNLLFCRQAK
jgi:hypothetical protein